MPSLLEGIIGQPTDMRRQSTPGPCLLLVEDDPDLREVLCRALVRAGCRVTAVGTPDDAVDAARSEDFDVAVLDRGLPGADGLTLMGQLHALHADMRAIVFSGRWDEGSAATARALGAFAYLSKPCRLSELRRTVEDAYWAGIVYPAKRP